MLQSAVQRADEALAEVTALSHSSRDLVEGDGKRAVKNLADAAEEVRVAAAETRAMISRLQGPTADFATNGLPQVTAAVIQLQTSAEALERLVNEIQSSPTGALGKPERQRAEGAEMMRSPVPFRILGAAALALCLSACVSLLPKTKPADLYRFGQPSAAESGADTVNTGKVGVFRANSLFPREAGGDRMLTVTSRQGRLRGRDPLGRAGPSSGTRRSWPLSTPTRAASG